jgi:hypothetical protein
MADVLVFPFPRRLLFENCASQRRQQREGNFTPELDAGIFMTGTPFTAVKSFQTEIVVHQQNEVLDTPVHFNEFTENTDCSLLVPLPELLGQRNAEKKAQEIRFVPEPSSN